MTQETAIIRNTVVITCDSFVIASSKLNDPLSAHALVHNSRYPCPLPRLPASPTCTCSHVHVAMYDCPAAHSRTAAAKWSSEGDGASPPAS